ncbi:hypothetical protein Tco_1047876, partial [Tanacetum coccineum]
TYSVNKSSSLTETSTSKDTQPSTNIHSTIEPTTPTTNVNAEENNNNQATDTQFQQDEFINPFCTLRNTFHDDKYRQNLMSKKQDCTAMLSAEAESAIANQQPRAALPDTQAYPYSYPLHKGTVENVN